jgi:aminoglycoside/choline kinase family phosphotransferase
VQSSRLHEWDPVSGPFRDEEHLNLQLRDRRPLDTFPPIVQKAHTKRHPLVFTHNDFFPRNIMIDEPTGRVLAIIDWESAGWFPEHWEYCISHNWGTWRPQREWMQVYVPKIVPVYEDEAKADWALMYDCGLPCMVPTQQAP